MSKLNHECNHLARAWLARTMSEALAEVSSAREREDVDFLEVVSGQFSALQVAADRSVRSVESLNLVRDSIRSISQTINKLQGGDCK